MLPPPLDKARVAAHRSGSEILAVIGVQMATCGLAQPQRLFQHRIEHRLQVAGRGIDDLQHLGGGSLLFQCLVKLGSALGKLTFEIGYTLLGIG
jgi:hypothetical protein